MIYLKIMNKYKKLQIIHILSYINIVFNFFLFIIIFLNVIYFIFIPIFLFFLIQYFLNLKYTSVYREECVNQLLNDEFNYFEYHHNKGLDENVIYETRMMFKGNKFLSNNLIIGKYNGVNFIQADIKIKFTHKLISIISIMFGAFVPTSQVLFKGKWILLEFNKKFSANFQVRDKWIANARVDNSIGHWDYKLIETENSAFNKKFYIYAYNPHDAFYVLTPRFMEKLLFLSKNIKGRIMLCFVDNILHVGVDNVKPSFKYSIYKKVDRNKFKEKLLKDVSTVTRFIDELNLENDIFK